VSKDNDIKAGLAETVVRICPACGVVNPSGPSDDCPHLQLVRFDGVDEDLEALIGEVARARRDYSELVSKLKTDVLTATREGAAQVETPHKAKPKDMTPPYSPARDDGNLHLTHPKLRVKAASKSDRSTRKRRRNGAPPVDPRQLELLANAPSKGDA